MRLSLHPLSFAGLVCLSSAALAGQGQLAMSVFAEPVPGVTVAAAPASLTDLMPLATAWIDTGTFGLQSGEQELDRQRGGTDTITNEAKLNGFVTGNSAAYVNTGANTIDGGAFANASGIPIVIQNSGANVLIQNATIIHLQMR